MTFIIAGLLVMVAMALLAMKAATEFLAWLVKKVKEKLDENKKDPVSEPEEMEPL